MKRRRELLLQRQRQREHAEMEEEGPHAFLEPKEQRGRSASPGKENLEERKEKPSPGSGEGLSRVRPWDAAATIVQLDGEAGEMEPDAAPTTQPDDTELEPPASETGQDAGLSTAAGPGPEGEAHLTLTLAVTLTVALTVQPNCNRNPKR